MAHRLCSSALCNTNGSTVAVSNFVGNVSTAAAGNASPGSCRSRPQYGNAILRMGGSAACDGPGRVKTFFLTLTLFCWWKRTVLYLLAERTVLYLLVEWTVLYMLVDEESIIPAGGRGQYCICWLKRTVLYRLVHMRALNLLVQRTVLYLLVGENNFVPAGGRGKLRWSGLKLG